MMFSYLLMAVAVIGAAALAVTFFLTVFLS